MKISHQVTSRSESVTDNKGTGSSVNMNALEPIFGNQKIKKSNHELSRASVAGLLLPSAAWSSLPRIELAAGFPPRLISRSTLATPSWCHWQRLILPRSKRRTVGAHSILQRNTEIPDAHQGDKIIRLLLQARLIHALLPTTEDALNPYYPPAPAPAAASSHQ